MPRNIGIKARIGSVDALPPRGRALAHGEAERINQDGSFFQVTRDRLKLPQFADGSAELMHFHRSDMPEARASDNVRVPVLDAHLLREVLARGCGVIGRVRKRRRLLRVGQTRVNLDRIEGLSDFIELEVVLREGQSGKDGRAIAEQLMQRLGQSDAPRLASTYRGLEQAYMGAATKQDAINDTQSCRRLPRFPAMRFRRPNSRRRPSADFGAGQLSASFRLAADIRIRRLNVGGCLNQSGHGFLARRTALPLVSD
jgi:adenylate cyclase class IV